MKKQILNYKEAIALVERYRTITLDEIEKHITFNDGIYRVPRNLTGFGSHSTCTLCLKTKTVFQTYNCSKCVYCPHIRTSFTSPCYSGENEKTYYAIEDAKTAKELLSAFRARAEHIKNVVNKRRKKRIIK